VLFGNPWAWNDGVAEKIFPRLKTAGFADLEANFTAASRVTHPDVDGSKINEERFAREKKDGGKYLAYVLLIDSKGRIAHRGPMTDAEVSERVEKLLKEAAPATLDVGSAPYAELGALAKQVQSRTGLGAAAKSLEKKLATGENKDEATRLLAVLKSHAEARETSARMALATHPAVAEARLKALIADFKGSEIGASIKGFDAELKIAVEFRKVRDEILKVAPCSKCKPLKAAFVCLTCETCLKEQADALAPLKARLDALVKTAGELPIAATIKRVRGRLP
jgi:hypothetical protein